MFNKKAVSAVVTISLFIVITILAVVAFQTWFNTYSSSIFEDVENQRSDDFFNSGIETIIGSSLYFRNGYSNITITEVKIGESNCGIAGVYTNPILNIPVGSCASGKSGNIELLVVSDRGVFSKQVQIYPTYYLDCDSLDGGEWVLVPGNPAQGTLDFCVMKYEAKWNGSGSIFDGVNMHCGNGNNYNVSTGCPTDGSVGIESKASQMPLSVVNQFEAMQFCENLGPNYHLINNDEWMTIARNVELVELNWADGTIGSTVASGGGLKRGNVGLVDSVSYNAVSDPADRSLDSDSKAMLTLSNSEEIWDFSGNLWEWTADTLDCSGGYPCVNMPYDSTPGSEWVEFPDLTTYGSFSYDLLMPSNSIWDSSYGVGKLYSDVDTAWPNDGLWNTDHAFLRGGTWHQGNSSGVYTLRLYVSPSLVDRHFGFRCAYDE